MLIIPHYGSKIKEVDDIWLILMEITENKNRFAKFSSDLITLPN